MSVQLIFISMRRLKQSKTDCKRSAKVQLRLQGGSRTLTDKPGKLLAIPIVPMVNPKTNRVRPLEEGEAVLTVPVVGLVPHPIVPGNLSSTVIPGPVAIIVVSVGAVHCCTDPPLVVILHAGNLRQVGINFTDQRLDQIVLLRTSALIHVNEPSLMESANCFSVGFRHSLVHPAQQDTFNLVPNITYVPAIRAGIGVLCS